MTPFNEFVLSQLPPPPARVLEVGCGEEGGVVAELDAAGYEPLGIDPRAPEGPLFRQLTLDELDDRGGSFDAAVASRVLHHVHPLDRALEKLARLAPLLLVDEFAPERIDAAAEDWYAGQYRALRIAGREPKAPARLDEWRAAHPNLHRSDTLLEALRRNYDETYLEWRPYLYRWLRGTETEQLERSLVAGGALQAIGWRWAGRSRVRGSPQG